MRAGLRQGQLHTHQVAQGRSPSLSLQGPLLHLTVRCWLHRPCCQSAMSQEFQERSPRHQAGGKASPPLLATCPTAGLLPSSTRLSAHWNVPPWLALHLAAPWWTLMAWDAPEPFGSRHWAPWACAYGSARLGDSLVCQSRTVCLEVGARCPCKEKRPSLFLKQHPSISHT